jgi:hypothetical protein
MRTSGGKLNIQRVPRFNFRHENDFSYGQFFETCFAMRLNLFKYEEWKNTAAFCETLLIFYEKLNELFLHVIFVTF